MKTLQLSERELFRALEGVALRASLKRTLAYCLFWMQHATHSDGDLPTIWKTGPELEHELSIDGRTGNRHLKQLAKLGYWSISYRPKPGSVGKVTWLTLGPVGVELLELADERKAETEALERRGNRHTKHRLNGAKQAFQTSHEVTSKHTTKTKKTTKAHPSFFLSGKGKKEALHSTPKELPGIDPIPPKSFKVGSETKAFAKLANESLATRRLQTWDWSSRYTWAHIDEIASRLNAHGLPFDDWGAFLDCILENWSWMRTCLRHRYASHDANLHAPSPMAFADEFERIYSLFEMHTEPHKEPTFSSFDKGFY